MSSAVAMNRRIAKEKGGPLVEEFKPAPSGRGRTSRVNGTPVQQCWQILNFHETRLNRLEEQTHVLTHHARSTQENGGSNESSSQIKLLVQRMDRLEQENAVFRKHLQQMNQKSSKKSMTLEVSEN